MSLIPATNLHLHVLHLFTKALKMQRFGWCKVTADDNTGTVHRYEEHGSGTGWRRISWLLWMPHPFQVWTTLIALTGPQFPPLRGGRWCFSQSAAGGCPGRFQAQCESHGNPPVWQRGSSDAMELSTQSETSVNVRWTDLNLWGDYFVCGDDKLEFWKATDKHAGGKTGGSGKQLRSGLKI